MTHVLVDKVAGLVPELIMLTGACVCMLLGLAPDLRARRATVAAAAAALVAAGAVAFLADVAAPVGVAGVEREATMAAGGGAMATYVKVAVAAVGLLLLLVVAPLPLRLVTGRSGPTGRPPARFEPGNVLGGEFLAFFLFSLTGVMLCAGAGDLVWLFLALELTSLPTYVMVVTSRDRPGAAEAAVKYFFLGALAVALFLYGFTLIYGACGVTEFAGIREFVAQQRAAGEAVPPLLIAGLVLSMVGVSFKVAAVPMHFYAADVYQGAATSVAAFLAFVPKTAGFVAIGLLLSLVPGVSGVGAEVLTWLVWTVAALSMTVGNVLALFQTSLKRVLAYSSIAHSGYMLVGLAGLHLGPASTAVAGQPLGNGMAAVLFYLVAYGLGNLGAFAVLAGLSARGEEAETFDDIAGLGRRHPMLAGVLLVSVLSLIGLPPTVGFLGKLYLFEAAIGHGFVGLVVIAVLNSAVSAVYYLRIVSRCYFGEPVEAVEPAPAASWCRVAAAVAAVAAVVIGLSGGWLVDAARQASGAPQPPRARLVQTPME